jgi:hypothetical protein
MQGDNENSDLLHAAEATGSENGPKDLDAGASYGRHLGLHALGFNASIAYFSL